MTKVKSQMSSLTEQRVFNRSANGQYICEETLMSLAIEKWK